MEDIRVLQFSIAMRFCKNGQLLRTVENSQQYGTIAVATWFELTVFWCFWRYIGSP